MKEILAESIEKMKEMVEYGEISHEECAEQIMESINEKGGISIPEQSDILQQLEMHTLSMMDNLY